MGNTTREFSHFLTFSFSHIKKPSQLLEAASDSIIFILTDSLMVSEKVFMG